MNSQISESDVDQYVDYLRMMQGHLRVGLLTLNYEKQPHLQGCLQLISLLADRQGRDAGDVLEEIFQSLKQDMSKEFLANIVRSNLVRKQKPGPFELLNDAEEQAYPNLHFLNQLEQHINQAFGPLAALQRPLTVQTADSQSLLGVVDARFL